MVETPSCMKCAIICTLVSLLLFSCSSKSTAGGTQPASGSTTFSFMPRTVETPETKEIQGIEKQAIGLLKTKSFNKLDEMADKFRVSKETYPHGVWKLFYFYDEINVPDGASDAEWTNHFAVVQEWIKTRTDSITARVALANGLVAYAWKARGGDYADKVSDEGWRLFFLRLHRAVDILSQSKKLKAQDPCWWSVLLKAELGLQTKRPEYDASFKAATNAWPDYTPIYFSRAHFLLPRWYGAEGELGQDLEKTANRIGGEAGDIVYAQVVWDLHHHVSSSNILEEYHLSWERTKRGLEALERRNRDALSLKTRLHTLPSLRTIRRRLKNISTRQRAS